jgi:hypothetical protein
MILGNCDLNRFATTLFRLFHKDKNTSEHKVIQLRAALMNGWKYAELPFS